MRMNCFLLLIPISWNHFFIIVAIWASLTSYSFSWTTKFIAWWKRSACFLTSLGLRTVCFFSSFLFKRCLRDYLNVSQLPNMRLYRCCLYVSYFVSNILWLEMRISWDQEKQSEKKWFQCFIFFLGADSFYLLPPNASGLFIKPFQFHHKNIHLFLFFRARCSRLLLSFCTHYIRASSCFSVECCYWRVFMSCCLFQGCKSWLVWPSIARYMSFFCLWSGDCIDSVEFAFHWICQIWRFYICTEFYRMSGWSDTPLIYSIYSPETFQLVICLFAFVNRLAHKVRIYVLLLCWCLRVTLYTLFLSLTLPNFGKICVVSAQLSLFPIAFCVNATFYSPANKLVFSNFILQQPV